MKRPLTIAAVQLPSVAPGRTNAARQRANFDLATEWLNAAAKRGADIACIGETFNVLGCKLTRRNTPALVRRGRHQPAGLVEHEIDGRRGNDRLAIHLDPVAPWHDGLLRIAHASAVDTDPSGGDQRHCLAARTMAEFRQRARQPAHSFSFGSITGTK